MDYKKSTFKIRGVVPLVMHNGQLADPLNNHAKEMKKVAAKRAKTESDFEQLAKLEWHGSLYLHDGKPCLPGEVVEAGFIEAAKKSKRGQQAKAGVISDGFWPIKYDGPSAIAELWEDSRFRLAVGVRVQRNRVMRTRPIFPTWEASVEIHYLPDQLNAADVEDIMGTMGRVIGLGDWRPRFGRFIVVKE